MQYKIKDESLKEVFELISNLEKLLTDRISDLHEVKGGMQARHAYMLYRDRLWGVQTMLINNLKEISRTEKAAEPTVKSTFSLSLFFGENRDEDGNVTISAATQDELCRILEKRGHF